LGTGSRPPKDCRLYCCRQRRIAKTNQLQSSQSPAPSAPAKAPAAKTYRVQPRETLAAIARKNGVTVAQLQAANPGVDSRKLKVGQELRIP
jgi:LysM repeat protein